MRAQLDLCSTHLWLRIKAIRYGTPRLVREDLECGVVGAAMIMATATGPVPDLQTVAARMVRYTDEIDPDPARAEIYDRMMPFYAGLYREAADLHTELTALH
ncbi:hypothetical protein [Palleronia caenipelagi]|uniref:Carbohydrate kinase FGGY C-terminal domain-containing protein n=1 Tax=Palleronia caenipelagi TaxID=2489174 RepID=A0A547PNI8_9RHOB|nr:hypothetical protein [Palleronia caenipelagi]TRD15594.1 hypothetical protein FEV53_15690 [Palleronia caenipelagi]